MYHMHDLHALRNLFAESNSKPQKKLRKKYISKDHNLTNLYETYITIINILDSLGLRKLLCTDTILYNNGYFEIINIIIIYN